MEKSNTNRHAHVCKMTQNMALPLDHMVLGKKGKENGERKWKAWGRGKCRNWVHIRYEKSC